MIALIVLNSLFTIDLLFSILSPLDDQKISLSREVITYIS